MSVPTVREIIRGIRHADDDWDAVSDAEVLAERVEAVLAEIERIRSHIGGDPYHSGKRIERLLNGEHLSE